MMMHTALKEFTLLYMWKGVNWHKNLYGESRVDELETIGAQFTASICNEAPLRGLTPDCQKQLYNNSCFWQSGYIPSAQ